MNNCTTQPRRAFPLSVYVAGLFLCLFIMTAAITLVWNYRSAARAVDREIRRSSDNAHAIVRLVLENRLDVLATTLDNVAVRPCLTRSVSEADGERVCKVLNRVIGSDAGYLLDILFVSLPGKPVWQDVSSPFYDGIGQIPTRMEAQGSDLSTWQLVRWVSETEGPVAWIRAVPIVDSASGRILGRLFGGIVLNRNLSLLDEIRSQTRSAITAFCVEGRTIGYSSHRDIRPSHVSCQSLTDLEGFVFSRESFRLKDRTTPLKVLIGIGDEAFGDLRGRYILNMVILVILMALLTLIAAFCIRSVTQPSLKSLVSYANEIAAGRMNVRFRAGRIREFNRLAFLFEDMVTRIQQNQNYIIRLFDSANVPLISWTPDLKITRLNRAAEQLTGVRAVDALGKPAGAVLACEPPERMADLLDRSVSGKRVSGEEVRMIPRGASAPRDVVWNMAPVSDRNSSRPVSVIAQGLDITGRKKAEQSLKESEERFRVIFEQAALGIAQTDLQGRWIRINDRVCDILGYARKELLRLHIREVTHPDDLDLGLEYIRRLMAGEVTKCTIEKRYIRRNQSVVWVSLTVSLVREASGRPGYFIALLEDITERKETEERLRMAASVFENVREAIFITDPLGDIVAVNPSFCKITGYARAEIIGKNTRILKSDQHGPDFYQEIWQKLHEENQWVGEIWDRRKNGEIYPKRLSASAIRDSAGQITHFVGIFSDLSAKKQTEEALYHLANFDSLTGLANRTFFMERLRRALLSADENSRLAGVIYLDLDNFKIINDTLGYAEGDKILKEAASRLKGSVKSRDTVARLGSDEFGIVLSDMKASKNAATVALRLKEALARPFELDTREVFLNCSIGISVYPLDSPDVDTLIKDANIALNHAKTLMGQGTYRYFSQDMNTRVSERLQLEQNLRGALERKEFRLFYQPKVDLKTGEMHSMEALIRWEHPDLGIVSPGKFIPLAEETGLISPIGQWVLESACRQNRAWQKAGFRPLRVAVNLSAPQFMQPDLVENIISVLDETGLEAEYLELEITESLLMEDVEKTIRILQNLKALGLYISIDDFGTGYSSLSYLRRFPIDCIKIDQSFIFEILKNAEDAAITSAIIVMAKSLNLKVIAEGVETFEHVDFLRRTSCEEIQGYYFSRPVAVNDFTTLLEEERNLYDLSPS